VGLQTGKPVSASVSISQHQSRGVIAVHWVCALDQLTAVITNDQEAPGACAGLAVGDALRSSLTAAG
jgi:hypothetical protein